MEDLQETLKALFQGTILAVVVFWTITLIMSL